MCRQVAVVGAVAAVALLAAPLLATAQQSRTLARYGDWSVTAVEAEGDVSLAAGIIWILVSIAFPPLFLLFPVVIWLWRAVMR